MNGHKYEVHYFNERNIDEQGNLSLPILVDFSKQPKSEYSAFKKDEIITIENIDIPVEKEFKVNDKKNLTDFESIYSYSRDVNDCIYFDDLQKSFADKNGVIVKEIYFKIKLTL